MKISKKLSWNLYVITDTNIQSNYDHIKLTKLICKGGADIIQFRDKGMTSSELLETAIKMKKICDKNNVKLIINDRVDIAMLSDADGVHLGSDDIPVKEARKLLGKNKIIGATAHDMKEANAAQSNGADYIGYGHIYPTFTKHKADKPKGIKKLSEIVKKIKIPVYAIGGINYDNIIYVIKTNVKGVVIAGAIVRSEDPELETKRIRSVQL